MSAAAQLRRAVPDDAAAIAAVHVRTWQAAYRRLMPDELLDALSVAHREEGWRQLLTGEDKPAVYLALEGDDVVGFCAVSMPSRDEDANEDVAEVAAIYVDPLVWRAGYGRALMDAALSDLRGEDWRWVTLWVLAKNHQARAFYAGFGFEPDGAEMLHERSGQIEVRLRARVSAD